MQEKKYCVHSLIPTSDETYNDSAEKKCAAKAGLMLSLQTFNVCQFTPDFRKMQEPGMDFSDIAGKRGPLKEIQMFFKEYRNRIDSLNDQCYASHEFR